MDCKEVEKQIPVFLNDKLEGEALTAFVAHVKGCKDCGEELTIQYLADEGLARIEKGDSFSLDDELAAKMRHAEHHIRVGKNVDHICVFFQTLAIFALSAAIVYMVW